MIHLIRKFFAKLFGDTDSGIFRQIPLDVKGKLYVSPMPFGAYDPGNRVFKLYKQNNIDHVFVLVTDEELQKKAKKNVLQYYEKSSIGYSQYQLKDFQAPSIDVLKPLVEDAANRLQNQNVTVHCHAGVGRTAVAVCCIVMTITNKSADETIEYVKQHMTVNITSEQTNLIHKFDTAR